MRHSISLTHGYSFSARSSGEIIGFGVEMVLSWVNVFVGLSADARLAQRTVGLVPMPRAFRVGVRLT
jgi:hypothetical protein